LEADLAESTSNWDKIGLLLGQELLMKQEYIETMTKQNEALKRRVETLEVLNQLENEIKQFTESKPPKTPPKDMIKASEKGITLYKGFLEECADRTRDTNASQKKLIFILTKIKELYPNFRSDIAKYGPLYVEDELKGKPSRRIQVPGGSKEIVVRTSAGDVKVPSKIKKDVKVKI